MQLTLDIPCHCLPPQQINVQWAMNSYQLLTRTDHANHFDFTRRIGVANSNPALPGAFYPRSVEGRDTATH